MNTNINTTHRPDEQTTMWNSSKYNPHTIEQNVGLQRNVADSAEFNYKNIQIPILDSHPQPSGGQLEGLSNINPPNNSGNVNNYIDTGLNAWETRVDNPPILPDIPDIPVSEEDLLPYDAKTPNMPDNPDSLKSDISSKWKAFSRDKTLKNAKRLAVSIVENIPELFFIPEMIANTIVKSATEKSKRNGISYAQNKLKVTSHLKSFVVIIISLYVTFNWWYLMLYTNHYIDLNEVLKSPIFIPMIWVIGPLCKPIALLNYYLLGKRTEPEFYAKNIEPVLKNKSFYLSILFISIVLMYEPIIYIFTTNMKDILGESSGTNPLVGIVIVVAVLSFLYSVVFNTERNIQFISTVSFLVAIVAYLIMFILVIMLAKPVSMFVIFYVVFYSFLFLLLSENVNFIGKIFEMMSDTTEQCVDNSSTSTFAKIKNILYRYSFFILILFVVFMRIGYSIYDVGSITEEPVRVTCYAIYLSILFVFLSLIGANFIDVFMNVKDIVLGEKSAADSLSSDADGDEDPLNASIFSKIAAMFKLVGSQLIFFALLLVETAKYIGIQILYGLTSPFMYIYTQLKALFASMSSMRFTTPDTPPNNESSIPTDTSDIVPSTQPEVEEEPLFPKENE